MNMQQQKKPHAYEALAAEYKRQIDELNEHGRIMQKNIQQMAKHFGIPLVEDFDEEDEKQDAQHTTASP